MVLDTRPRVLLLSPHRQFCSVIERELPKHDIAVEVKTNAVDAIKHAAKMALSAVLVDDRPNQKQSLTTIAAMRKTVAPTTALVWITDSVTRKMALAAIQAGADNILIRPAAVPLFLDALVGAMKKVKNESARAINRTVALPQEAGDEKKVWAALDRADSLRAAPFVVQEVLSITSDDEAGADARAKVIQRDPNTTALVLKRANSALYGASRKITSLQQSTARIGFRTVRSLVLTLSVIQNFKSDQRNLGFVPSEYWKFCTARAILARELARHAGVPNFEDAYVAGLIHDIGKIVCDEHVPELFHQAVSVAIDQGLPLVEAERAVMGTDHVKVGQRILERWNFPALYSELAGLTTIGQFATAREAVRRVGLAIGFADAVCRAMGYGDAVDRGLEPFAVGHLMEARLDRPLPADFFEKAILEVNETWKVLGEEGTASVPGRNVDGMAWLYEENPTALSALELAILGAGVGVKRVGTPAAIAALDPTEPALLQFARIAGVRQLAASCPGIADRPWIFVLPGDQFPVDDEVKKSVGLPVGRCAYLGCPFDARAIVKTLLPR